MTTPILTAKLFIPPPRPGVVTRRRLLERLDEGLYRKLVLISAPAGFGKTTLVSDWIAGCGQPVAWLSLDPEDNDPIRFLTYLVSSLQTIFTNISNGLVGLLESPQPPSPEFVLTILLNELSAVPEHFFLVLDDYHVIDAKPVNAVLVFLLEHLPQQMHLFIATREDPPLPLARPRARDQLTELRAADLRFSPSEAAEFLNRVLGLNLQVEDVAALEARTEGWITGLQLAGVSMQGQTDIAAFIRAFTGSHRFILDYLVEEVLEQQPDYIQSFLLRTSILERLSGSLCDAVLSNQTASGQETLEYLERSNLFIVPLDNERHWYRYHQLFTELLRQRLNQSVALGTEVNSLAEYHSRASRWYEVHNDLGVAFHHATKAGDFVRAARLAEAAWQERQDSFQTAAWLGWVKNLPEEVIRVRPVLCTLSGRAYANAGEAEASELRLQDAERCLERLDVVSEAELKPLPAMIALTRAYNAQTLGNFAATVFYAELALRIIPENDFIQRAQAIITLQITHWASGNLETAIQALGDWMDRMTQLGNYVFVVASAFGLADMLIDLGRLNEAERVYLDALQLAARHAPEAERITAHHHLGLYMIYRQRGEDTRAAHHLNRAAELGLQTPLVDWWYRWHIAQAQLKEAAGDLEAALALFDKAEQAYIRSLVPDLHPVAALKARLFLKQGRYDKVRTWAAERGLSLADEVSYLHEFEYLTLARLEITHPLVIALLERLLQASEAQKRRGSTLDILLVLALAHQAQDHSAEALVTLKRALYLAEPEGYLSIFVEEGEPMRALVADLSFRVEKQISNRAHSQLVYTDKLLAAFTPPVNKPPVAKKAKPEMDEPLSERELEVLRLVAQGLSNRVISARLFLALTTIKGHNQRIFDKLQVQNRTEAVARARELGLL